MKFEYAEGATPIDVDEAGDLIPSHITTQKELNEWEQNNILNATLKHTGKKYGVNEILDPYFLFRLHKEMLNETWKWAGQIRQTEKSLGVAPEKIREELKLLLDDVKHWIGNGIYSREEICVRFHRRLVWVHLFANGNGRHARFAADLLAESLGIKPFTWGSKDLINDGEDREIYLKALRIADLNGQYMPLIDFAKS